MSDKLKKLTGKNPKDFEPVAYSLINTPDTDLFKELVAKDDYLYDFIKQNVAKRLQSVCNNKNYTNLLQLMKFYSPSYEELIVGQLVKYADEDLTDIMLDKIENGTDDEKTYCAKYFSFIQDPLAIDFLRRNAYSDKNELSSNSISALSVFGDKKIYNDAIAKLDSNDEFEQLEGVKILISYGDKSACNKIINIIKQSPMAENIASELPYLCSLDEIIDINRTDGFYILNLIIQGLGETISLSQLYDFNIYNIFEKLIKCDVDSLSAIILHNAKEKFSDLTENNEYLYDQTQDVKDDVYMIKELLVNYCIDDNFENLVSKELVPESIFVLDAISISNNYDKIRTLLDCDNPMVIIKALERLKTLKQLIEQDKQIAIKNISDDNIKNIIFAL